MPLNRPVAIAARHDTAAFNCGAVALNTYLARYALANHLSGAAKTFVATADNDVVVGYYSLAAAQIVRADATTRLENGVAQHPIPVVLLARLAVDGSVHGLLVAQRSLYATLTTRLRRLTCCHSERRTPLNEQIPRALLLAPGAGQVYAG